MSSCSRVRSTSKKSNDKPAQTYQHPIPFTPKNYVAYHSDKPFTIDGKVNEDAWSDIPWTDSFVDIEGQLRPLPLWTTRAKMSWNDEYFIVAATMDEPHIWATLTERDAIMYHDDDIELFIDPDGDGHNYFEFEMNAFNAIWDLYMLYPYKVDGQRNYIMSYDIRGIQTAVDIKGTINNPADQDTSWSVEIAIPWTTFKDFNAGHYLPATGEQWRINFSRVDWTMGIEDGKYVKQKNPEGKTLPEDNWVWSPTGYVNMHKPETWGYVQFERDRAITFLDQEEEDIKWAMWKTYYAIKACHKLHGMNCTLPEARLKDVEIKGYTYDPKLYTFPGGFVISASSNVGGYYTLDDRAQLKYYANQ